MSKQLTFIVNYLSADDAQHFVHIPNLMFEMEKLGWQVDLVSERGGTGTAVVLGRRTIFLSQRSKWKRIIRLIQCLLGMRLRGGKLVFVRISRYAALASALLGHWFGWRTVFWLSGTVEDFNLRRGLRARWELAVMWLLFRLVDRLATGPETMVDYYSTLYGLPKGRIMLLYNDVDLAGQAHATPASGSPVRVLLVHRLSPVRETARYFLALLQALERHAGQSVARVSLDICGDGPERPVLEQMAASASPQIDVRFHGAVPQRQLREFYAQATIFVMPSYREGFPRVVIEAMAHGLPIVATDAGGTRDLCGPAQQAFVVNRDDSNAFGLAVERLLASPPERRRIADENLETVKRFSTPEVARMYDRALSSLIGQLPAS